MGCSNINHQTLFWGISMTMETSIITILSTPKKVGFAHKMVIFCLEFSSAFLFTLNHTIPKRKKPIMRT